MMQSVLTNEATRKIEAALQSAGETVKPSSVTVKIKCFVMAYSAMMVKMNRHIQVPNN